ncbi:hypothetical protein [Saccharopolyspora spinosa]|uniref:DUF3558 domain-containing protein n=1 Tax=Saccharopolyspora spinosa TaxID=60894 RepID=A0A2N3XUI8_SACSN|nr:hypothetical protein [Saccharopolyspora spinosa]PKW14281.1 hypothetical protein A8926_1886 [Saccharopolyspora spinosa]
MQTRSKFTLGAALITAPLLVSCSGQSTEPDPFSNIPDACTVVSPQAIQEIVGGANGEKNIAPIAGTTDTCGWSYQADDKPEPSAQGVVPYRRGLSVQLYLHKSVEGLAEGSGVRTAQTTFSTLRNSSGMAGKGTLDGIGDEAYGQFDDRYGKINFRQGNITVEIRYEATGVSPNDTTVGLGADANRAALMKAATDVTHNLK